MGVRVTLILMLLQQQIVKLITKKQYTYKWSTNYTVAYIGVNNLPATAGHHTMDIGAGADHITSSS